MSARPSVVVVAGNPQDIVPIARRCPDDVPDRPFGLHGQTFAAVVDDSAVAAAVLRLLSRGADAVVRIDLADDAVFRDALARVAVVSAPARPRLDAEQRALLDLLANGLTAGEAARRLGMSLRTAHRRLSAARTLLGVGHNTEAVRGSAGTRWPEGRIAATPLRDPA